VLGGDSLSQIAKQGESARMISVMMGIIEDTPFMPLFGAIHRHTSMPEER